MNRLTVFTAFKLIFFIVSQATYAFAQVYPGDVNSNGEVNNMDFLVLTTVFGETGSPRVSQGTDWGEYEYESWGDNQYNSNLDVALADGNGDGVVDEADIDVIYQNAEHFNAPVQPFNYQEGIPGTDPNFKIDFNHTPIDGGRQFEITISTEGLIEDFKGMVFSLKLAGTTPIFDAAQNFNADFFDGWASSNGLALEYFHVDQISKELDFGIARTDLLGPISSSGVLAKIDFIIMDDFISYDVIDTDIEIIKSYAINALKMPVPLVHTSKRMLVPTTGQPIPSASSETNIDGETVGNHESSDYNVSVYPNPTAGIIYFELNNTPYTIAIRDHNGNLVALLDGDTPEFNLAGQQPGHYHITFYDLIGIEVAVETVSLF